MLRQEAPRVRAMVEDKNELFGRVGSSVDPDEVRSVVIGRYRSSIPSTEQVGPMGEQPATDPPIAIQLLSNQSS